MNLGFGQKYTLAYMIGGGVQDFDVGLTNRFEFLICD